MATDDDSWALPLVREGSDGATAGIPGPPSAPVPTPPHGAFGAAGVGVRPIGRPSRAGGYDVAIGISPLTGFWLGLVGLFAVLATGALRLALAPRRAPFPELRPGPPVG